MTDISFGELKGQVILSVTGTDKGDEETLIETEQYIYRMYHHQDCCESVSVEDVEGDIQDLIGQRVVLAEEVTQSNDEDYGTSTWTFYRLASEKGFVVIRWIGESNGYYSESVDLSRIDNPSYVEPVPSEGPCVPSTPIDSPWV